MDTQQEDRLQDVLCGPATLSYQGEAATRVVGQVTDGRSQTYCFVGGCNLFHLDVRRTFGRFSTCSIPSSRLNITFTDSFMLLPLEHLTMQSQEILPVQVEEMPLESEEIRGRERSAEDLARTQRTKIESQKVDIFKLRRSKKRYERRYRGRMEQVAELEQELGKIFRAYMENLEKKKRVQAMEDELARTKELLEARSTELSAAQSFLSTADRVFDADVVGMVHDLNKNVSRVAANLTQEWKKLGPSPYGRPFIPKENIDDYSQSYGPVLIHQSLQGDPDAVNLLVRSCFCLMVTQITSSWRQGHGAEFGTLGHVYRRLYASGRYRITHSW